MNKTILLVTLMTSLFLCAQEKIEYIDYDIILEKIDHFKEKEAYDTIIEELDKISTNDSVYESSLVTKSYCLLQQEKNDEAIKTSNKGLNIVNGKNRYSLLINKGAALLRTERYKEALIVCNNAIKEYPKNHVFFYYRGIIHEQLEMFEKAVKDYIHSIELNPFYGNSHLQLGKICLKEHKTSQALMAINMYLLLNPDGEESFEILNSINTSVSKNNEVIPNGIKISSDDDTFQEIDMILNNRIALNPNYKIENKINIALTKQNHALFEQLDEYEGGNGFWDKKYVPFYKWIFKNGHFDDFIYTISYKIENKEFKKIVNKNVSKIKTFIGAFYDEWTTIMSNGNERLVDDKKIEIAHVYDDYTLRAMGKSKGDKKIGDWQMYNHQGKLKGKGQFNENGERIGNWIWYNDIGEKSINEQYVEGKLEGKFTSFYPNKNIKIECNYKAGKLNGLSREYNEKGALVEKKTFSEGKLTGLYSSYYSLGESAKKYVVEYKNDILMGEFLQYHPNGNIFKKRMYTEGAINGEEQKYYNNKILQSQYNFINGKINGSYTIYHKNGTKYEEGTLLNGNYNSDLKLYYTDGTIMNEYTYAKGKLNGLYKEYDIDGKLHYEFVYKNDEFIEYRYFDKEGNSIVEAKKKKGEFYYKGYSPLGDLVTEGLYDVKGGKKGEWKYYENNVLVNKGTYKDNMLDGKYYDFYNSGQKESITEYKNDSLTGYYISYHKNGKIAKQGWYKNDASHGTWVSYYKSGLVQQNNFYHKGLQHGKQEYYGVEGKLSFVSFYEYGNLISEKYYTPSGEVLKEIIYDPTQKKQTVTLKHYNGETYATIAYLHTIKHGDYREYDYQGNKSIEGAYFNGEFHGVWTWYYDNGQISTQGEYFHGAYVGEWKKYFKNGIVKEKYTYQFGVQEGNVKKYTDKEVLIGLVPYKNDKIHGERIFYSPEGKVQLVRYYHNNKVIGYSYTDKNGKLKPMIPLENYTGSIKAYFDNGKPSLQMELKNGFFINDYKAYYYSGQLERIAHYKDGDNHGEYIFYYPDGKVKKEMNYRNDELHGLYKEYYKNGASKEVINYLHDSRTGVAKYFDENGKLIKELSYFNDLVEK